jgi:hypothetical protein
MLQFDAPLTFREFMTHEELPLATVFREVLLFLGGRKDAVLFGAQAVNAYCETERMTHDIDVLSTDAAGLAEALRAQLADRFHIAVRAGESVEETGYRVYQLRKPKNRHLVDIRQADVLPSHTTVESVQVVAPPDLIGMKVRSLSARRNRPKGDTDRADLHRLLFAFPELKVIDGEVAGRLRAGSASDAVMALWSELVDEQIEPDEDEGY